jgi:uncharacterized membrane protein
LKLEDFGTFVIFTAVYAAGSLGLPKLHLLAYQLTVGEMAAPFVAIFGMPAVFGLTLGQFIANLGFEVAPVAMLSPAVSFVGLVIIYYLRKTSALGGCIVYILLTSLWITFLLPQISNVSTSYAAESAFLEQTLAVMIGYVGYLIAKRTMANPNVTSKSH